LGILLCGVVLGVVAVEEFRHSFFPKRFGVVEPGLIFRSGQIDSGLIKPTLQQHGIKVVVDLTKPVDETPDDAEERDRLAEAEAIAELGITSYRFTMPGDGRGSVEAYTEALIRLKEARAAEAPVLVHCAAGSQRTGGVIACYRVLFEKQPMDKVMEEMKDYDWDPVRNAVLPAHLNGIMKDLTAALHERGALEMIPDPLPVFPVGD
jgi:protein tyrosine/serine phosphatase